MEKQKVVIELRPDGTMSAEGDGFKGPSCEDSINKILGRSVTQTSSTKKSDYHKKKPREFVERSR